MLSDLLVVSALLSLPSLYLAYRLHKKDYLGTVFNRQIAVVLVVAGLILPVSLTLAVFRLSLEQSSLSTDFCLECLTLNSPVCSILSYLEWTWYYVIGASTITSVLFRLQNISFSSH